MMEGLFIFATLLVLGTIIYVAYDAIKHFTDRKTHHH